MEKGRQPHSRAFPLLGPFTLSFVDKHHPEHPIFTVSVQLSARLAHEIQLAETTCACESPAEDVEQIYTETPTHLLVARRNDEALGACRFEVDGTAYPLF